MNQTANRFFWILIACQLIGWTLVPTLVRHVLPIDANEGFVWGQHFEWGYDRNPWVNALITHFAVLLGGKSGWLVYACSQFFVCLAYWSVWQIGKILFSPLYALIATFMLIGIQYYSIAAVDLNDNVIGLGLWPFMVYAGFQAYRTRYLRYWLLGGIAAGLAMMTKYYAIIPVICLLSFFIIEPKARGAFKEWGIYLATGIAFLICLPHLLWLPKHNWITITYAQSKVHMTHPHWGWINHFIYATHFAGVQIGTFCGALILLACLAIKAQSNTAVKLSSDFKRFILINALGPFDLTLLISVIFGWKLNTLWGMPLLSLWPLVILTYWRPVITPKRLKIFITTSLVIWTLLLIGYTIGKTHTGSHSSANIPGKQLSQLIRQKWRNHFHTPLKYCAGNRYLCGYVAYFSPHPISIYIDWNPILSSWINPTRFKQKGAVFLVFANKMHTFPQHILQQYPNLQTTQKMQLIYHRAKRQHPSLNVLMAFLPPA